MPHANLNGSRTPYRPVADTETAAGCALARIRRREHSAIER